MTGQAEASATSHSRNLKANREIHYVPSGAASVEIAPVSKPKRHFVFLLQPGLSMNALSAAIDPLRIANQLASQFLYSWEVLSEDGAPVTCSNGLEIGVQRAIGDIPKGSHLFVCSGVLPDRAASARAVAWVRSQWANGCHIGGICTGAYTLAKAGLLAGRRFTLHWENIPGFVENFPDLVPENCLYTVDGRIVTCCGGAAATDLFTRFILDDFGEELALVTMDMCVKGSIRSGGELQKSALALAHGSRNTRLLKAVALMNENIEEPLDLIDLADRIGISKRQLERLFKKYLKKSPGQFYASLRVKHGRALLIETSLSVEKISLAAGFNTVSQFGRRFKKEYGASPRSYGLKS